LTDDKVLQAYDWFINNDFRDDSKTDAWASIVNANQDKFEIGKSDNGYFKVVHYSDIEIRYDKGETEPKLDGYTYIKNFYFGTDYWIFKKNN